jgi:diguanylate cyclase (GGDEF)-like protein/PAS domain S-box-containing protein
VSTDPDESGLASLVELIRRIPDLYFQSWDAIAIYRLDGTLVSGNKIARALSGDVDLAGSNYLAHMDPQERATALREFGEVVRTGKPITGESVFSMPNGVKLNVEILLMPAHLDGVMVAIYGVARDVTPRKQFEREMHQSQQRLLTLFENHPDSISVVDVEGRYQMVNRAAEALSGFSAAEYRGKTTAELFDPANQQRFEFLRNAIREGRSIDYETSVVRGNDGALAIEGTTIPIRVDGVLQGAFNVVKDVTAKRHYEAQLIRDGERMRHLYQIASSTGTTARQRIDRALRDGMVQLNADFAYVARLRDGMVNIDHSVGDPGFEPRTTAPVEETLLRLVVATDEPLVVSDLTVPPWNEDVSRRHESWTGFAAVALHVAGRPYGVAGFATRARRLSLEGTDREYIAAIGALIASAIERDLQYQRLTDLAHQDPLTGLPNRALLLDRIDQTLLQSRRYKRSFALHFLDFDDFKQVNDQFGHAAGDELLIKAAAAMAKVLRESDTLARVGGDEFVVLQPEITNVEDAEMIRQRLCASVEEPFPLEKTTVRIGVSAGTAVFPSDGTNAAMLLEAADQALYRDKAAKKAGDDAGETERVTSAIGVTSYASLHHLICACGHTAFSHGARGCRVPERIDGRLRNCPCVKTLEQIYAASAHPRRRKGETNAPLVGI